MNPPSHLTNIFFSIFLIMWGAFAITKPDDQSLLIYENGDYSSVQIRGNVSTDKLKNLGVSGIRKIIKGNIYT